MEKVIAAAELSLATSSFRSRAGTWGDFLSALKPWELYQFVGDMQTRSAAGPLPATGWSHDRWAPFFRAKAEADNYDIYADIEEGILECRNCHSKTVLYYSKRVRASDEPETIYALCGSCKRKWAHCDLNLPPRCPICKYFFREFSRKYSEILVRRPIRYTHFSREVRLSRKISLINGRD